MMGPETPPRAMPTIAPLDRRPLLLSDSLVGEGEADGVEETVIDGDGEEVVVVEESIEGTFGKITSGVDIDDRSELEVLSGALDDTRSGRDVLLEGELGKDVGPSPDVAVVVL